MSETFLIATSSISHNRCHTNYSTEPPTVSIIFPTLSHYEYPRVLPENMSDIFSIINNYMHYCFTSLHYKHSSVLSKAIMFIIVTKILIIIAKAIIKSTIIFQNIVAIFKSFCNPRSPTYTPPKFNRINFENSDNVITCF